MKSEATDFYTVNNDFSGERVVEEDHEIVQHQGSCAIRIWCNDLPAPFDTHWHTDLEIIMHFIFLFDISAVTSIHGFAEVASLLSMPLHITKAAFPQIYGDAYQTLEQIRSEYFSKNPFYELTVFSLLMKLFVLLGKNHLNSASAFLGTRTYKQQEYVSKFNSVMAYIDEHFAEDFRLEDAASFTGFSKYHFSRLFKQYTGYTFCSYVFQRRIRAAEQLLEQPGLSITEIAIRSGFSSIPTFNRVFRQQMHCTPTEYRAKNNKLNPLLNRRD